MNFCISHDSTHNNGLVPSSYKFIFANTLFSTKNPKPVSLVRFKTSQTESIKIGQCDSLLRFFAFVNCCPNSSGFGSIQNPACAEKNGAPAFSESCIPFIQC